MGRWILDLLLLLNLVAFLAGSAHQVPLAREPPPLPDKVPRLHLLPPAAPVGPASTPQRSGKSEPPPVATP